LKVKAQGHMVMRKGYGHTLLVKCAAAGRDCTSIGLLQFFNYPSYRLQSSIDCYWLRVELGQLWVSC